jgi:hypothetical protein
MQLERTKYFGEQPKVPESKYFRRGVRADEKEIDSGNFYFDFQGTVVCPLLFAIV